MPMFYTKNGFFEAVEKGDVKTFSKYVKKDRDWLQKKNDNGDQAVHIAARKGNKAMLTIILEADPDICFNYKNKDDDMPLHLALREKHEAVAEYIHTNTRHYYSHANNAGENALHIAAANGLIKLVGILSRSKYDLATQDKQGDTSLHKAVRAQDANMVALITDKHDLCPVYANNEGQVPLHIAAERGDIASVRAILKSSYNGADKKDLLQETPLHKALKNGNADIAVALIDSGRHCDLSAQNTDGQTAMHLAVKHGLFDVVDKIMSFFDERLAQQADNNGQTPLDLAAQYANIDIIQKFMSFPAFVTALQGIPDKFKHLLPLVLEKDHVKILDILLKSGKVDTNDGPAIYLAAKAGSVKCLKLLIDSGADLKQPNVSKYDKEEPGAYEYDYSSSSHIRRMETKYYTIGTPALYAAIENGHTAAALMLLDAGADPHSVRTDSQYSGTYQYPLHLAVKKNNFAVVYALLEKRADKHVREAGKLPIDLARQFVLTDIIEALQADIPYRPVVKKSTISIVAPAILAPVSTPVVQPQTETDKWIKLGQHEVANVRFYPALNRTLTDIFNFDTCERRAITENRNLRAESMAPAESFDQLSEQALNTAVAEFVKQGGTINKAKVFKHHGILVLKARR